MRIVLFLFILNSSFAKADNLGETITNTHNFLMSQQIDGNHWSGAYTLDVSNDAIVLGLGIKLGLISEELKNEITNTLLLRMHSSKKGWVAYPKGGINFDITLLTLKFLEMAGINRDDEKVKTAWEHIYKKNRKIGVHALMHLIPIGLLGRDLVPNISIKILGVSEIYPFNFNSIGILQTFTVPYVTWGYFHSKNNKMSPPSAFSKLGVAEMGLNNFLRSSVVGRDEFWAKEGIRKILEKQNPTGGWYALSFAYVSMLALHEAQKAGAGDFQIEIKKGWDKIVSWRSKSFAGFPIQQAILSDVWDTASIANAFQYSGLDTSVLVDWLVSKSTSFAKEKSRAWSFDSGDRSYPDIDDTAVVVQALANSSNRRQHYQAINEGLKWVLDRQNSDGGFPAWVKGINKKLFDLGRFILPILPEVEDVSQMDITGRVVHTLSVVEGRNDINGIDHARIQKSINKACRYLETAGEGAENVPFKISQGHWFSNYFYSASMQLTGLIHGKCDQALQEVIVKWLLENQNRDGGWGESNLSFVVKRPVRMESILSQTTLVLASLIEYYKLKRSGSDDLKESIQRGIDFLVRKSEVGNNWNEDDFAAVVVKNYLYNRYELMPAYAGFYVLNQWQSILTKF